MSKLNFSTATAGFLVAALLLLGACNPQPKKEAEPEMMDQEAEKVDAPKEIISLDEAKELCDNYETRRITSILEFERAESGDEEKFIPTQFVAFKLETLKTYIKYVEQEAKKANVTADSLRVYLGNYGKEGSDPNRNTVFVLPTAKVGNEYGGFYIDGTEAKLIRNYWPGGENGGQEGEPRSKASFVPTLNASLMQGGGSLVMNRGQSGPPPYGDF
ncbi:MAG: hypothetical protein AAF039_01585 [Bacteroidota bacterium]